MKYNKFFIILALCMGMLSNVTFCSEEEQKSTDNKSLWERLVTFFTQNNEENDEENKSMTALEAFFADLSRSQTQKQIMKEYATAETERLRLGKELDKKGHHWGYSNPKPELENLYDEYKKINNKANRLWREALHNDIEEEDLRKVRKEIYINAGYWQRV
jgi:hypothetical protein